MKSAFDRALRQVRLRCHANLFLERLTVALTVAGLAALLAAAGEKFFGLTLLYPHTLQIVACLAVLLAGVSWIIGRPTTMQVAILIDQRLGMRERFSTSLALRDSQDPFAQAACNEAHQAAGHVSIKGKFPVCLSRRWIYTAVCWAMAGGVILFVPQMDVMGFMQAKDEKTQAAGQLAQAKADLAQQTQKIEAAVKQFNDPQLAELAKIDKGMPEGVKPEDIRRDAIKKMEALSDKIQQAKGQKMDAGSELDKMMRQLRGMPKGQFNDINTALAKGQFNKAGEVLKEIQKQLDESKLTDEQKKALAGQLSDLAKQLDKIAKDDRDAKEELDKAGLDRKLADLNQEDLKKALEKQGLSQEQAQQLMKKLAACKSAGAMTSQLAQAMAAAGASDSDVANQLSNVANELAQLEAMEQDADAAMAALKEIQKGMLCMGQCKGDGEGECEGLYGEWKEGDTSKKGRGTGGPGIAYGQRDSDTTGDVKLEKSKLGTPGREAPAVASWYVKGSQVKGESTKEFKDVIQAAKDGAAEAINDNEIPKKYEGPVKKYFGELEDASKK